MLKKTSKIEDYELISEQRPKSAIAEAYRILRTNVGFAEVDKPYRIILISSPRPQDGKSFVIANLAVVMAQAGHKVILIDADLRKPKQQQIFQINNEKGLTNCLLQHLPLEEVVHTGIVNNLSILSSGPIPPNPAEILNSQRCRDFWPALREQFEYVLIDSPPVLAVTDASIIAAQVDGVLMLISAGTRVDLAKEAKAQLNKANARIIGIILNRVKKDHYEDGYYYYYGRTS